jgi:hypothetical protein
MKRLLAAIPLAAALTVGIAAPAFADTTGSTGPPSGNSGSSPGAPFNEPTINSTNGGTAGAHYSEKSQYDVACFQWNAHHS